MRREDSTEVRTWSEVVHRGGTNQHTEVDKTFLRLLSQNNPVSKAVANGRPKRKPNSVLVSVTLKIDAIRREKPNANALSLGDSVPISQ